MNIVDEALAQGATYADLRHDISKVYNLIRENRRTTSNEVQINAGSCLRVLVDGSWGTGITTREEDLPSLLTQVVKAARAQKRKHKVSVKEAPAGDIKTEKRAQKRFVDEDKTDLLKSVEADAYDKSDRISSSFLTLSAVERWVRVLTSEQRTVETRVDRISFRVSISCKAQDSIESRTSNWGNTGGMEFIYENENKMREQAGQLAREAHLLAEADHSPSGTVDCVFSNTLTGTLLHEAFGHGVEADLVISNESLLAGKVGEKVAAECVTMVDDPTRPLFGYYGYDHEGVKAEPTVVVDHGVLKSFLHSRETAALLDAPLTGHCKAEFYSNVPIVRQGNTILLPGDYSADEVCDLREGLFLGDSAGGQVNVGEGTFTFGTQYTREIKNGELGPFLRGCSLSGNILETMQKVDAVGKEVQSLVAGCGKGQMDYQGRLMPTIRVREVMIGGRG